MQTHWYVVPTKEALALGIPDVSSAGEPPYLLIDLGGNVVVFDFNAMLAMVEGFNNAVVKQMEALEKARAELEEAPTQDGVDAGS